MISMRTPPTSTLTKASPRKRKAHTKSRSGCGNCKLRRVKCDEAKPRCNRCTEFGVSCNYGPAAKTSTGELVLSFDGASLMEASPLSPVSVNQTTLNLINHSLRESPTGVRLGGQVYQLRPQDLGVLDKFHNRSVLTVGTNITKWVVQAETARLACLQPFLMHIILAFTTMHDRLLQPTFSGKRTALELFHHYNGTALFNDTLLRGDATSSELDAIWISSTLIGAMQMCLIDASTPEEAWPLKSPDPGEPDWLTLNLGKHEICDFCNIARSDSCFQELWINCNIGGGDPNFTPYELKDGGFPNLPPEMLDFLDIRDPSVRSSSPYFLQANILSQLLPQQYNQTNLMKFTSFINLMQPEFRGLWSNRDPGALVLLSYWYARTIPFQQWWTWRRSVLECQAICIYLERYHSDIPHLEHMLEFPKQYCGLVTTSQS